MSNVDVIQVSIMVFVREIWEIIFSYLHDDAHASVRLGNLLPYLTEKQSVSYWNCLEATVRHPYEYWQFCNFNSHLGVKKRVVCWVKFCDAQCGSCGKRTQDDCLETFPLRCKLCLACQADLLISEWELARFYNVWSLLYFRKHLIYCWLVPRGATTKQRFFFKEDILRSVRR